jgi:hypothetical protein
MKTNTCEEDGTMRHNFRRLGDGRQAILTRVPQLAWSAKKVSEESGFLAAGGYEGNRVFGGM